jgi:hypothetical protein
MNYRYPLKSWMVDIFKEREINRNKLNTKFPFVIMSSAAKIVKSDPKATKKEILNQVAEILKSPNDASFVPLYKGCIITNHIDPKINYNVGKTLVGYDFRGKPIECDNETGRKISPVIIESVDIKVDGSAAFSKMATVRMRCFSLAQLELVEQFFLQMGMHVLIEFGDNSNISELINNKILATKEDYNQFVKDYLGYQTPTIKEFREYLEVCKKSKGTYDRYAGILYDYNYKIEQDGTYTITASYIQGNEINYAMPMTVMTSFGQLKVPANISLFKEIMYVIGNDMNLNLKPLLEIDEDTWKDAFFNWRRNSVITGLEAELTMPLDNVVSYTPYISLWFILKHIVNNLFEGGGQNPDFLLELPNEKGFELFKVDGEFIPMVPIKIHKYMTAQDGVVLFPSSQLPWYGVDGKGQLQACQPTVNGKINGFEVPVRGDKIEFIHPNGTEEIKLPDPFMIGDATNVYIDYNEVLTIYRKSYNRIDFIVQILELINDRSFGFFKLGYGTLIENKKATIVDFKLYSELKSTATQKDNARSDYRFKPLHYDSIVRDFDYTFTMDAIMASVAIRNANAFVAENKYANEQFTSLSSENQNRIMGLSSYANHTTSDGLYSINQIQYEKLTPPQGGFTQYDTKQKDIVQKPEKKNVDFQTISELTTLIKYRLPSSGEPDDIAVLAVANPNFLYTLFTGNTDNYDTNTQVLSNISISFKLDGISGFNIGETFNIDGVPEMRNKVGQFRISNIEHQINTTDGWTTTIQADWVYTYII